MNATRIFIILASALSLQALIAEDIPVRSHPVSLDLTFHSQGEENSSEKSSKGTTTTSYSAPIIKEKFGNRELLNRLLQDKVIDSVSGWSLRAYYDEVTCEPYGDGIYIEKKGKQPIGIMSLYDAELKQVMFADAYKGQATEKSNGVSTDKGTGSTTGQMMFSFGGTPRVHGTLNSSWAYSDYEDANTNTSQTLISRATSTNVSGVVPTPSGEKMVTGSVSLAAGTRIMMPNLAPPDEITEIEGFSLIPQGAFTMGDSLDGISDAPTRTVTLDAFYMGQYEVTKAEWDAVRTWGLSNGYTDLSEGEGKASNHPIHSISWYDMVKWCNARSQMEGLTPAYYTNDAQTTVYKTGYVDVTNAQVKWTANGYRLPTEAEWEKAARGGLSGKRFPWGNTISHSQANYSAGYYPYDLSASVNNYATGVSPYTSPVGAFAANGYGLYDMAGNVWEWCWDWYGTYAPGSQTNPRGASSGSARVMRGGGWESNADSVRVTVRDYDPYETYSINDRGFRVVRSSVP
ncbi:MAG: formylglycine-generating enzyme family protein [Verrucomicrobia bacterium]|nr:formylglycine-generating enzyme family protein [Verrucomicrobiota bacterium]